MQPRWRGPAFNAQNDLLDAHSEKYKLQDQDWRKQKPWSQLKK